MAKELNATGDTKKGYSGDCICPACGTKVIGGDHSEIECG